MRMNLNPEINFKGLASIEGKKYNISENKKAVLFVVDMNAGFAKKGALYSERVEKIIPDIYKIIERFIQKQCPVFAFTDCHTENSVELKNYPVHCLKGTEETELVEEFKIFKDKIEVIEKNSTNAFLEKETVEILKKLIKSGYESWVIVGCCTDICISQFSLTLKAYLNKENLDHEVIVPVKGVETYDAPWHNGDFMNMAALMEMQMNGIVLVEDIE